MSVRAWPFESKYLRDFAVVEERQGNLRLLPATEQLPLLSQAIDQEFRAGLTSRLTATDGRADAFRKYQLWEIARAFCALLNTERADHLHLQPYCTPDLLTHVAVVQQTTEPGPGGNRVWFRFFHGDAFLPEVYLSGKRVVFSGHAIQRYRERTLAFDSYSVINFAYELFSDIATVLQLNGNQPVLVFNPQGTVAALPFDETNDEFFIRTTLSPDGRSSLAELVPPRPLHFHYGPICPPVSPAGFSLDQHVALLLQHWRDRTPHGAASYTQDKMRQVGWTRCVQALVKLTHNHADRRLMFHDNVYGPTVLTPEFVID